MFVRPRRSRRPERGSTRLALAGLTRNAAAVSGDTDYELRIVAIGRVNELANRYGDIVPVTALREGFTFAGRRIPFGTFYSGIFRPRELTGPAALSLTTAPPKISSTAPYDDGYDATTDSFVYHYRSPQSTSARAVAAAELTTAPSELRPASVSRSSTSKASDPGNMPRSLPRSLSATTRRWVVFRSKRRY